MEGPTTVSNRHQAPPRWRLAAVLCFLVVTGVAATACSRKTPTTTQNGKVPVRVWRTNQSKDAFASVIKSFEKDYPSADVTYREAKLDTTYELDSLKSMAARTGPDVWSIPNDWLGDHLTRIQPLPANYFFPRDNKGKRATTGPSPVESIKELYPAGVVEYLVGTDTETVYGLPTNVDTLKLYFNQSVVDAALSEFREVVGRRSEEYTPVQQLLSNPPATWQDLVEQSRYITKTNGNEVIRSAIALGTADNIPTSQEIVQLLMMQNGANLISVDRLNATFHLRDTTASGTEVRPGTLALEFFTSFAIPGMETYSWNPSMPDMIDAFGQGKVAMIIGFSDVEQQLKTKYPKTRFRIAPVPQKSATEAPVNLIRFSTDTVTKTAANTNAGFAFLSRSTSQAAAVTLAGQAQLYSPYLATLERRASDPFVKQILTGKAVYKKSRLQYDAAFRQMIVDVTQNDVPAEEAIVQAANAITLLLQDKEAL